MRVECLIWHVDFVGKRVSRETLGDGVNCLEQYTELFSFILNLIQSLESRSLRKLHRYSITTEIQPPPKFSVSVASSPSKVVVEGRRRRSGKWQEVDTGERFVTTEGAWQGLF
ncbi:hypothetical protein DEO72_LG7g133 [Vigna unguiculata]|uniref:Uncharacterized protein n=1 Tax=Vigna unguiculata TaxID=3917 RepID=A0A4D6MFN7_VIGUN|nr:hypothetical protein DEO72_LG7g133 [Vigna unguiculata]